jgi:hypothetical protein
MKKLFIFALVALSFQIHAQNGQNRASIADDSASSETSAFHLTPAAGPALVRPQGKGAEDYQVDAGYQVGGFAELGSGYVTFQSGLLYSDYASKVDMGLADLKLRLDYLTVPVLAKINLMGTPDRTVYIKVGLLPEFLVNKTAEVNALGQKSTFHRELSINTFDLPATLGVGGAIKVARNKAVVVEASYLRGLTKINTDSDYHVYNEGFLVTAGFTFGI